MTLQTHMLLKQHIEPLLVQSFPLALTSPPQKSQNQISLVLTGTWAHSLTNCCGQWMQCPLIGQAHSHIPLLEPDVEATHPKPAMKQGQEGEFPGEVRALWTSRGIWSPRQTNFLTVHYTHQGRLYGDLLYLEAKKRLPSTYQDTILNTLSQSYLA